MESDGENRVRAAFAGESAMSLVDVPTGMTTEEMLALPENGTDRELIRGVLRERPVTKRNALHSVVMANISFLIKRWRANQPRPRGWIVAGEAGIRLLRNPDTSVGIDVAYVSPEVVANKPAGFPYIDGPPVLAVEILSPSDTNRDVSEKLAIYRESDVPIVWIVNPDDQTVRVYRRGELPKLFNLEDEIHCDPEMPGFRAAVADIFDFE